MRLLRKLLACITVNLRDKIHNTVILQLINIHIDKLTAAFAFCRAAILHITGIHKTVSVFASIPSAEPNNIHVLIAECNRQVNIDPSIMISCLVVDVSPANKETHLFPAVINRHLGARRHIANRSGIITDINRDFHVIYTFSHIDLTHAVFSGKLFRHSVHCSINNIFNLFFCECFSVLVCCFNNLSVFTFEVTFFVVMVTLLNISDCSGHSRDTGFCSNFFHSIYNKVFFSLFNSHTVQLIKTTHKITRHS